jgi:hypothetical protein
MIPDSLRMVNHLLESLLIGLKLGGRVDWPLLEVCSGSVTSYSAISSRSGPLLLARHLFLFQYQRISLLVYCTFLSIEQSILETSSSYNP